MAIYIFMKQTLCPYARKLLTSAPSNEEHIIPAALGGPRSFTVQALVSENSRMNRLIDEPSINDPILKFMAMSQGTRSRSGMVSTTVRSTLQGTNDIVLTKFSRDGVQHKFLQPVVKDEQGNISTRGFGDADEIAAEVIKNYAKRGISINQIAKKSNPSPELRGELIGNLFTIRKQLLKIAYLSTVRVFGDEAITSPSGLLFLDAIHAKNNEELAQIKIKVCAFQPLPLGFATSTAHNEHAITCTVMPGVGLLTAIDLFKSFTLLAATPLEGITADEGTGEVIRINASTATLTSTPYMESLALLSRQA